MPKTVTKVYLQCEGCKEAILNPKDGYLVKGNIYVAQTEPPNGLIGTTLPQPDNNGMIPVKSISETAFCKSCFRKALHMGNPGRPRKK